MAEEEPNIEDTEQVPEFKPWDPELQNKILDYMKLQERVLGKCKSYAGSLPNLEPGTTFDFGEHRVRVLDSTFNGSSIYFGKLLGDDSTSLPDSDGGKDVTIKVNPWKSLWEMYITDTLQKRLSALPYGYLFKPRVAPIFNYCIFTDCSVSVSEKHCYGTLASLIEPLKNSPYMIPECIAMHFALQILVVLFKVHRCRVVHANLKLENIGVLGLPSYNDTTGNFFVNKSLIQLLGFEQAIDMQLFKPGLAFTYVDENPLLQCPAMRDRKPWIYEVDYYGYLCIVYYLVMKKPMIIRKVGDVWTPCEFFEHTRFNDVWMPLFHDLLNVADHETKPNIKHHCLQMAEKLNRWNRVFSAQVAVFSSILLEVKTAMEMEILEPIP